MADRRLKKTVILAKSEGANYGIDAAPVAANAVLVSNVSINPFNASYVDRSVVRPYLGASEQLPGDENVEISFDVELVGAGTVATAPAYNDLLLACAFAGAATTGIRYDYTPVSDSMGSATLYWYDDGLVHKALGCRGNVVFKLNAEAKPVMSYRFIGIYVTPTAVSTPTGISYTSYKPPQAIKAGVTSALVVGGTHSTSVAPAIATGTTYPSLGLEVDMGLDVNHAPLVGQETVDVTDRQAVGKVTLDLTAAQEAAFMADVEAATLRTVGLVHGSVANNKVMLWLPSCQFVNPQKVDRKGKRLVSFDLRCVPVSGNDEVRLVTSF